MNRMKRHTHVHQWLFLALAISIPFSLKLSTFILILLLVNRLISGNFNKTLLKEKWVRWWIISAGMFFILLACRSLFESNPGLAFKVSERKAAFLLVPLALLTSTPPTEKQRRNFVMGYSISILLLTLYVLIDATIRASLEHCISPFFYHNLGSPFHLHAVYFSALLITNLILSESIEDFPLRTVFQLWLLALLILLSSKLMILIALAVLSYFSLKRNHPKRTLKWLVRGAFILPVLLIAITNNPVSKRFTDVSTSRLKYINAISIGPDVYLDGLSLRILQLRFALEIVQTDGILFWGTGPGSSQAALDAKYRSLNLYEPKEGKSKGYIGYNFHNQYAETLVQGGVFSFISLIACFGFLFAIAKKKQLEMLFIFSLMFMLFCLTESVFERQQGVFTFLVFACWFIQNPAETKNASQKLNKPDLL
ncbi:MAG: hypothetical protein GC180_06610 [Bacteroidetes bacterium]|nr:hypothetical protein [Bacteroidota bacterium]